jgi:hypothetical protein
MSVDANDAENARRIARAQWSIARFRLGEEPDDDLSESTSPAQRIAMMWVLAESAWKMTGRPLPTYERCDIPATYYRPGTRPPDGDDA